MNVMYSTITTIQTTCAHLSMAPGYTVETICKALNNGSASFDHQHIVTRDGLVIAIVIDTQNYSSNTNWVPCERKPLNNWEELQQFVRAMGGGTHTPFASEEDT